MDDSEEFEKVMGGRTENYLNLAYELLEYGFAEDANKVLLSCPAENPMKYYALAYCCSEDGESFLPEKIEEAKRYRALGEQADYARLLRAFAAPSLQMISFTITEKGYALRQIEKIEDAPAMAHYYLGELLYDKKRYQEAAENWETCVTLKPDFAPAHRNLSIAYYNHKDVFSDRIGGDSADTLNALNEKARKEIAKANLAVVF